MRILFLVTTAIAFIIIVNADDKVSKNATKADVIKTKETRGKRNLNLFGNFETNRRRDVYNYSPAGGYNYESSNFIGGGSAPDYHHNHHQQYQEPPEPIIEIIIQDNNETLPEPLPIIQSNGKKKKEQVQVFYVKYHKDEQNGLVIHDPVAALSPIGHEQNSHDEEDDQPIIVTPLPNILKKSTTLRTIIRPESEQYESNSGVHVTFNHPHNHHSKSDNHISHDEEKLESAIQPVVQLPQSRIGPLPVAPLDKHQHSIQPSIINQGRVVNHGNFHHPPQPLIQQQQQLPLQHRQTPDFNPHNNFVSQGVLPNQLTLPSQDASKPFHPQNLQFHQSNPQHQQQHQHRAQIQAPIPLNHQQQFGNQLGHQQFNQPPPRHQGPIGQPNNQQQSILKPPQRPPVGANFNQNQRPFNYHAFPTQPQQQQQQQQQNVRFPNNQPQHQQPNIQRPQILPSRPAPIQPPQQNFHVSPQQLPPFNRPHVQFNGPPFQQQQQLPHQQPPLNFKPELKIQPTHHAQPLIQPTHHAQPLIQHNQFAQPQPIQHSHNIQPEQHHPNVFQGGLVEQQAPNLSHNRQHFSQPPQFQQSQENVRFHQEQNKFIQSNFGTDVQVSSSVPKFEHHITETVNAPIFFQPKAVDMERLHADKNIGPLAGNIGHLQQQQGVSDHRFALNQQGSVSNHFSQVFPQIEQQQKQFPSSNYVNVDPRNVGNEHRSQNIISHSPAPVPATTRKIPTTTAETTTVRPSTTKKPNAYFDLPDEIPDDLRKQLEESGVLENAQISILDYDKIGETSLQDLPPEHLANFFNSGGGAQIGASNKVISVLKPNGESVDDKIEALQGNKDVAKLLSNAGKFTSKKDDVNLKAVKVDAQSQKDITETAVLPTMNVNQNFSRYLPIKINGAHFPIPDADELRGRKILSVVVLAPVLQDDAAAESHYERDILENKHIKFLSGDIFKNLIKKPSSENFKRWLEKEQKSNADAQSVVLLVTKDSITNEQQIFMYDISTKTVNRLSGELSSKFVDVAEDNASAQDENGSLVAEQIDRIDEDIEDSEAEPSNIVESVVKLDGSTPVEHDPENKVLISSGYSVIKNE